MPLRPDKIEITINATINVVDSGTAKKLDELIAIVKGQQVDTAQVEELTRRLNAQSAEMKQANQEVSDTTKGE